ncbi:RNA polymerase II C-terminal domain phosphoserine binding [Fragilaria crotonensis]|nr:RNA polymerase II C-terminal domain phosphoserine binding [Fragilaria crotonensis]
MSSNVLFDDDSSDEELQDEEQQPKKRVTQGNFDDDDDDDDDGEAKVKEAPKRTIEIDEADDDDDDDDDDKNVSNDRGPTKTNEKASTEQKKVVYSPDEEDVEFDDGEGIVGSAAPTKPASDSPPKLRRPKKMTVLNSKRPSADTTLHITKLPNVVGIQPEPFDVDTFKPEDEEAEYNGYVHNMIRWRYQKDKDGNFVRSRDGKLMRESNARLVKWDDGSMTLHVGSEVFLCDQRESGQSGYPGLNGYLYLSQKATFPTEKDDDNDDDNEDEQPGGTVLECMGPISKLSARPSSLQSAAHKALTVAVRQKTTKRATIAAYVTNEDPEKLKEERIRQKTDLDKAQARKNTTRHYTSGSTRRTPGMNRRYMEEQDANYDSVNIKDLKRRDRPVDDDVDYASEDDDDDEDVGWSRGRLAAMRDTKKRARQSMESDDEGEEEFNVGGDDSDDEEQVALKKPKKAQSNMFDDDED